MVVNEKIAVSVSEAAQLLGLSRPTVYKLIHRGKLEEWAEKQAEGAMGS